MRFVQQRQNCSSTSTQSSNKIQTVEHYGICSGHSYSLVNTSRLCHCNAEKHDNIFGLSFKLRLGSYNNGLANCFLSLSLSARECKWPMWQKIETFCFCCCSIKNVALAHNFYILATSCKVLSVDLSECIRALTWTPTKRQATKFYCSIISGLSVSALRRDMSSTECPDKRLRKIM